MFHSEEVTGIKKNEHKLSYLRDLARVLLYFNAESHYGVGVPS